MENLEITPNGEAVSARNAKVSINFEAYFLDKDGYKTNSFYETAEIKEYKVGRAEVIAAALLRTFSVAYENYLALKEQGNTKAKLIFSPSKELFFNVTVNGKTYSTEQLKLSKSGIYNKVNFTGKDPIKNSRMVLANMLHNLIYGVSLNTLPKQLEQQNKTDKLANVTIERKNSIRALILSPKQKLEKEAIKFKKQLEREALKAAIAKMQDEMRAEFPLS
jgi:hypothetical protein